MADPIRDRPMTGIHTKDSGVRTMHGIAPLDPSYSGTVIEENAGVAQARAARIAAGLEVDPDAAEPEAPAGG